MTTAPVRSRPPIRPRPKPQVGAHPAVPLVAADLSRAANEPTSETAAVEHEGVPISAAVGGWHASVIASRCPVESLSMGHRVDPYWDEMWRTKDDVKFRTAALARKHAALGRDRIQKAFLTPPAEARRRFITDTDLAARQKLLALLFGWRALSLEQAAAFSGLPKLRKSTNAATALAFSAGFAELGNSAVGMRPSSLLADAALIRPTNSTAIDDWLSGPDLTWAETVSITGGQPWASVTPHDVHNVLATELALRLAEYAEIGTVLGERFSSTDLLAGTGCGLKEIADGRSADFTVIREDGMRIAVEVTRTIGQRHQQKIERWARLLSERPFADCGLTVVFVVTSTHPSVLARTRDALAAACKEFPGSVRDRVAERMGVVQWEDWFSARHVLADEFFTMRVERPTGLAPETWEPCDLLDAASRPFTPRKPEAMRAVLDNAALLGQTPVWLTEGRNPPDLVRLLSGGRPVPVPTPARPPRSKGYPLGAAKGAAGPAGPPERLRGLAGVEQHRQSSA